MPTRVQRAITRGKLSACKQQRDESLPSSGVLAWQGIDFDDAKQREKIKVFSIKERVGSIDRVWCSDCCAHCYLTAPLSTQVVDDYSLIAKDMFAKGADFSNFIGMKVQLESGSQHLRCGHTPSFLTHRARRQDRLVVWQGRQVQSCLQRQAATWFDFLSVIITR